MTGAADPIRDDGKSVDEIAADWLLRRQDAMNHREEDAFLAWLAADPAHKKAYDQLAHGWAALDALAVAPQISAMRTEALVAYPPRRSLVRQWGALAAILIVALVLGVAVYDRPRTTGEDARIALAPPRELHTVKGERSTMTLTDGSTITLNTDSKVQVDFRPTERRIRLLAGQAYFQVAHDKTRPFIVSVGDREVVALGTEFDIRIDDRKYSVALVEGSVRIGPRTDVRQRLNAIARAKLSPGEQLVFSLDSPTMRITPANVADLSRWREGQVRFDAVPLSEAVAEMNRYSATRIVIADARLTNVELSGVFQTGQSQNFVFALTELFPVGVERTATEIRLSRRENP